MAFERAAEYLRRMAPTQSHSGRRQFQAAAYALDHPEAELAATNYGLLNDDVVRLVQQITKDFSDDGYALDEDTIRRYLRDFKAGRFD